MISVEKIKKIIKEEIDNNAVNSIVRDIMACEAGDQAACARIEEYSEDIVSNDLDLDAPVAKLKKISEDFSSMVMQKDNLGLVEMEFFILYAATAQGLSDRYSSDDEGLLKSLAAAALFFRDNIERFPVELIDDVRSYIDIFDNSGSEAVALSERNILSEIPLPGPGEAPMTVPVDSQGVPNPKPVTPVRNPMPDDITSASPQQVEGSDGWSCYRGKPPAADVEDSPGWWLGVALAKTPSDLDMRNARHAWRTFYLDPMLGPEDLKSPVARHGSVDPKWSEYWLANQLLSFGIGGYDEIYQSMTERDDRGYIHSQPFENISRSEALTQRLADIQVEISSNPSIAVFKRFICKPGALRRGLDFLEDLLSGADDNDDLFNNIWINCEFEEFTYDPRGADSDRHIYCYSGASSMGDD